MLAARGFATAQDVAECMSALISDVVRGRVTPRTGPCHQSGRGGHAPSGADRGAGARTQEHHTLTPSTHDFVTVYADPPWTYGDKLSHLTGARYMDVPVTRVRALSEAIVGDFQYLLASDGEGLSSAERVDWADDGFLFLWTTNPMLLDGSAARVCGAWDFVPKQLATWVKGRVDGDGRIVPQMGMGRITRGSTEQLIIATRGRPLSLVQDHGVVNVFQTAEDEGIAFVEPRRQHSRKPDVVYDAIERLVPGPYLEVFARVRRDGWTAWGDELPAGSGAALMRKTTGAATLFDD